MLPVSAWTAVPHLLGIVPCCGVQPPGGLGLPNWPAPARHCAYRLVPLLTMGLFAGSSGLLPSIMCSNDPEVSRRISTLGSGVFAAPSWAWAGLAPKVASAPALVASTRRVEERIRRVKRVLILGLLSLVRTSIPARDRPKDDARPSLLEPF